MAGGKGKSPREYGRRGRSSARTAPAPSGNGRRRGGGEATAATAAGGAGPSTPSGQLMSPAGESTATAHSMAGPDLQSGYFEGGVPPDGAGPSDAGRGSFQLGDSQHSLEGADGSATGGQGPTGGTSTPAAGTSGGGGEEDGPAPEGGGEGAAKLKISASALSMATSTGLSTPLGDDASPPPPGEATTAEDDLREVETARTRRNSIDEDILLGRKRDLSAASLDSGASGDAGGGGKRPRRPPADGATARRPAGPSALYARPLDIPPSDEYHTSATGYSVRRNLDVPAPSAAAVTDGSSLSSSGGDASVESFRTARSDLTEHAARNAGGGGRRQQAARWRAHRMAEDVSVFHYARFSRSLL